MEERRTKAYQFDTLQQWCVLKSSQSDTNITTKYNRPVMHGSTRNLQALGTLWEYVGQAYSGQFYY